MQPCQHVHSLTRVPGLDLCVVNAAKQLVLGLRGMLIAEIDSESRSSWLVVGGWLMGCNFSGANVQPPWNLTCPWWEQHFLGAARPKTTILWTLDLELLTQV